MPTSVVMQRARSIMNVRRVPRHAVDRPALRSLLDAGCRAPLTLIVAPAGSGKSVLLGQWVESRPDLTVAWMDIRPPDDDATLFAHRLVDAVADVQAGMERLDALVDTSGGGLGEPFVDAFAAHLADRPELVVVFDDLHHLAGSQIVADLFRLTDRIPENAHFVFASRADLQLSWSRHRLTHGLVEVRQAQLAFDEAVTAEVLEKITGEHVSEFTAATVARHTEGWAAGVQLSALSLRRQEDPEQFADQFAESDRLIIDYLSEEVLDAQTAGRQQALLRLSALDEVCGGLAEAVTGVADGAALLRELELESMFLVTLPDRAGWFRFHNLFRDLLRFRLRAADAGAERSILRTAVDWHLARGQVGPAAEYLIRMQDWDGLSDLVLASGRDVYEAMRTTTIARWLSMMPEQSRRSRPLIELLYGITSGMSGHGARAVEAIQHLLATDVLDIGARQVALSYLAACVYFQPRADRFLDIAERSIGLLAEHPEVVPPDLLDLTEHAILEAVSRISVSRARLLQGDLVGARCAGLAALAGDGSGYGPYRVQILGTLALIDAWAGCVEQATEHADIALDLARELSLLSHPAPADAYLARAIIAIQRAEPGAGALSLHEGYIRAASNQRTQLMWIAHLMATYIDPHASDFAGLAPAGPPPPIVARALAAADWRRRRLSGGPRPPVGRPESSWSTLAFEQVAALLQTGAVAEARAMLTRVHFDRGAEEPISAIERDLAFGWLAVAEGHAHEAKARVMSAMVLAESEWLVHAIATAGSAVLRIVRSLPATSSGFREAVLRADASPSAEVERLADPLTSREVQLLEFLPTRLTNVEIAARSYVSVNTVKTHLSHIYRKLGVQDRSAAIVRARQLRLLPSEEIVPSG